MVADVFISYAPRDDDFAKRLTRALQDQGVSAFSDADMKWGEDWGDHLRRALDGAAAMVVVMSPAAVRSPSVLSEIGGALAPEKPILSVTPPKIRLPHDIPYPIGRLQTLRTDKLSDTEIATLVRDRLDELTAPRPAARPH